MTAVGTLVRGKGPRAAAGRVVSIARRYGPTDTPMVERMRAMTTMLLEAGLRPTVPVPASVLARRPARFASLAAEGAEIAIHGLQHVDHLGMAAESIEPALRRARETFERAGLAPLGFRAPYLRAGSETVRAVGAVGLRYDASPALAFPMGDAGLPRGAAGRARARSYAAALEYQQAAPLGDRVPLPWLESGVVRLPYALPDDEGLDRLGGAAVAMDRWPAMLALSHARGGLLCLGLHPERFPAYRQPLAEVLRAVSSLGTTVWRASLREVAEWWRARAGARLEVAPVATATGPGGPEWRITATSLPPGGALLVVWPDGRTERTVGATVTLRTARRPVVAVDAPPPSPATADRVVVSVERWPGGARSALNVSGDVDAVSLRDFALRIIGR